jgi:hypothetical protein
MRGLINPMDVGQPSLANVPRCPDLDAIDAHVAIIGVSYCYPYDMLGGIDYCEATNLIKGIAGKGRIAGIDILEVVSAPAVQLLTCLLATRLTLNAIGAMVEFGQFDGRKNVPKTLRTYAYSDAVQLLT